MRLLKNISVLFLFIGFLCACQGPYTMENNGQTIELSDESSFQVSLDGDPGSDNVWLVVAFNRELIKPGQTEITEAKNASGEIVKIFTFTFDTQGSGQSQLELIYVDEKNGSMLPLKTFGLNVICGTMGRIEEE
jgi:predicted secreted protein